MRFNSRLSIDLTQLQYNFDLIKQLAPQKNILVMVKSNSYGHGTVPIAETAIKMGIHEFGVASLGEGLTLRKFLPERHFEIYVFSDLECYQHNTFEAYTENRLIPVISSMEVLQHFFDQGAKTKYLPLALKFNTGMNRLGLQREEMDDLITLLKQQGRSELYHIFSHFACASQKIESGQMCLDQLATFQEIKKTLRSCGISFERSSMANSGAIEQGIALDETHIRPGLLNYGPSSLDAPIRGKSRWTGKLISTLETQILHRQIIKQGDSIGYGATPAPREGLMTLLALGYGDGLYNTHFKGMKLEFEDLEGEIIGRINMDMTAVLWPLSAYNRLTLGTTIRLWDNKGTTFFKLCDQNRVSPYEILCGLSERIPRIYRGGEDLG